MTAKPKPMKPVKGWAHVGRETGAITWLYQVGTKRHHLFRSDTSRIVRVSVREIHRKPAKGK